MPIKSLTPLSMIDDFLKGESLAGVLLMVAAACALVVANSPLAGLYDDLFALPISVTVGTFGLAKPLVLWVNDGLMAVFFFLVGLEIKREVVNGELSSIQKATLPVLAAVGGVVGPASVYLFINQGQPENIQGWAIPTATDIAFALGILALLGSRVPASLKIFLTALAVIDDLAAIIIIALFYTADLSPAALVVAAICIVVLIILNRMGVRRTDIYVAIGLVLWVSVLKSGVHATLAGVITALAIPASEDEDGTSPLTVLEHKVHPWVTYFILPLFAFANAGVALTGLTRDTLLHPVTVGIAMGLFVGKQAGVMGLAMAFRTMGIVQFPKDASLLQFYGVAVLTGVGFTMSLFIGTLAFTGGAYTEQVKLGVIAASVLSGVLGYTVLRFAPAPRLSA